MRLNDIFLGAASLCLLALVSQPTLGQVLYSQDFQVDDSANWTLNDGPTDEFADYFFDYGADTSAAAGHVAIPPAPKSSGGETESRGMFLQANLFDGIFGGFSTSPTGQSFSGDYRLSFDLWSNYVGNLNTNADSPPAPFGPASGQTNLSMYGIESAGNVANYPGSVDGIFFANTHDGDSSADYRAYSSDREPSYKIVGDVTGEPNDVDAIYHAGTRNQNGQLYVDNFGGSTVTAPAGQLALYPTQIESPLPGVAGMAWHEVEIDKIGDIVTWSMDDVLLITLDTSNFTTATGGSNILFGHSDTNSGVSTDLDSINLLFTLIDNIEVSVLSATTEDADFDNDLSVDGDDFLKWQQDFPITDGTALPSNADANGDGNVDGADLAIWETQYGSAPPLSSSFAAVPEPASLLLLGLGVLVTIGRRAPR